MNGQSANQPVHLSRRTALRGAASLVLALQGCAANGASSARTRLDRAQLRGRAQTVLGLIAPDQLGPTLMHEHILWDGRTAALRPPTDQGPEITLENRFQTNYEQVRVPRNIVNHDRGLATRELVAMRDVGGRTAVDLSSGGFGPDPLGLAEVSRRSGVNIVMGCGQYVEQYQDPANRTRSVEDFAAEMITHVLEGAWDTPVRAGIIGEIGCQNPWTELEHRVLRGALIAQSETGAAISLHPGRDPDQPQEIVRFLTESAAPRERIILCHMDTRGLDEARLLRLAESGVGIEFDLFGYEQGFNPFGSYDFHNDADRIRWIRLLIGHGHLSQILISHDIAGRTRLLSYGGHGYGHIFRNVLPMMRQRNFMESEIQAIIVDNPRRYLTLV